MNECVECVTYNTDKLELAIILLAGFLILDVCWELVRKVKR